MRFSFSTSVSAFAVILVLCVAHGQEPAGQSLLQSPLTDAEARVLGVQLAEKYGENPSALNADFITPEKVLESLQASPVYRKQNASQRRKIEQRLPAAVKLGVERIDDDEPQPMTYLGCRHDANKSRLVVRVEDEEEYASYWVFFAGKTAEGKILVEDVFAPELDNTLSGMIAEELLTAIENTKPLVGLEALQLSAEARKEIQKRVAVRTMYKMMQDPDTWDSPKIVRLYEENDLQGENSWAFDVLYINALWELIDEDEAADSEAFRELEQTAERLQERYPQSILCEKAMLNIYLLRGDCEGLAATVAAIGEKVIDDPYLSGYLLGLCCMDDDPDRALALFREAKAKNLACGDFYADYLLLLMRDKPELEAERGELFALLAEHFGHEHADEVMENLKERLEDEQE